MRLCVCKRVCCKKTEEHDDLYSNSGEGQSHGFDIFMCLLLLCLLGIGISFPLIYPWGSSGCVVGLIFACIFCIVLSFYIWYCCDWKCCVCTDVI